MEGAGDRTAAGPMVAPDRMMVSDCATVRDQGI